MSFRGDPIPDLQVGDVLHVDDEAVQVVATAPRGDTRSVSVTMGDHMFQVVGAGQIAVPIDAARRRIQARYRIECLSCEILVHAATPTPLSTAREHLRRVDPRRADGRNQRELRGVAGR